MANTKSQLTAAQAEIEALKAQLAAAQAAPVAAAAPAIPKDVAERIRQEAHAEIKALGTRSCACGCGATTKSTFAPGHDAKHAGALIRAKQAAWLAAQATPAEPAAEPQQ